jgi:PIN domain nuclease of toxin-antitoxin system
MNSTNKNNKNKSAVLDTSALLTLFYGAQEVVQVQAILEQSCLSILSWQNILADFHSKGGSIPLISEQLNKLGLELCSFDHKQAELALSLLDEAVALSLCDRAAIALAISRQLPLYTTHKSWTHLRLPIQVILI